MGRTRLLEWVRRTHGPAWAGVSLVLFAALLGSSSVHDHAHDAPGTSEIHCLAVAGSALPGSGASVVELPEAAPARLEELDPRGTPRSVAAPAADRARAPPVGTADLG